MGDLVEVRTWCGLGVIVVFVVRFGFVFCLSVAFACFVFHMHASHNRHDKVDSWHDVVRFATLLLHFFLFVLLERTLSAVVTELAALISGGVLVYFCHSFTFSLFVVFHKG